MATGTFTSNQPITISSQTQQRLTYCVTFTSLGKQCPTTYSMPFNPNWSDLEGKEEDWNGERQKEKKLKEQELENNSLIEPQSPQYQLTSTTNTDDTILAPELTNNLVPTTEKKQKEEQTEEADTENNSETISETDYDLDDMIDNIV